MLEGRRDFTLQRLIDAAQQRLELLHPFFGLLDALLQRPQQIFDRADRSGNPSIKTAGQALTEKLTEVEGEIYQHRLRSGQDPLNYPIRLNNKLAALQGTVEGRDYRPTDQAVQVFKQLSARLDAQLKRLDGLVTNELAGFNRTLQGAGQDAVKDGT